MALDLRMRKQPTRPTCQSCQRLIEERWMLHVGKQHYHAACLRCSTCQRTLDSHSSCFFREGLIFCRNHYLSRYSTKCAGCSDPLQPSDWVRRARDLVYHLECFRCSTCHRKLSTGDTCVLKGDTMLCPDHIAPHVGIEEPDNVSICSMDSESRGSESSEEKHGNGNTSTGSGSGNGKRQRTSFTAEQVATLQDEFRRNPNPSPEDLERIADLTGHTRKVVMIWFQNARARNKKLLLNGGSNPLPSKKQGVSCHWNTTPRSPGTIPFLE